MIRGSDLTRILLASICATVLAACPSPAPEGTEDGSGGDSSSSTSGVTTTGGPGSSTSSTPASSSSGSSDGGGPSGSTSQGSGGDPAGSGGDPAGSGGEAEGTGGTPSAGSGGAGGGDCGDDEELCDDGCKNLTNDGENCGECEHSCQGGECTESKCEAVVVAVADSPATLALTADEVWWTDDDENDPRIMHAPKDPDDGSADRFAGTTAYPFALALTDEYVVWADFADDSATKIPLDDPSGGSDLSTYVIQGPRAAVVDDGELFIACERNAAVLRVDPATGEYEELEADIAPSAVALDDEHVYFVDLPQFGSPSVGNVSRTLRDGSGSVEILVADIAAFDLTVFEGRVYYTDDQGVWSVAADGSEDEPSRLDDVKGTYIAVDASGVYWFRNAENLGVYASNHQGGDQRLVVSSNQVRDIALDEDAVYWSDMQAPAAIRKLAK